MDIRNTRALKTFAAERLGNARDSGKIVLIYSGLVLGLAALTTVIRYVLGLQIDQTSGLSSMGTRSVLSALRTMLPLVQSLAVMCLDVGYLAAMLRVARGQYVSPQTLRLGFDRFWTLLRCSVIQGLIYGGLFFASVYAASMIFVVSPLGQPFMEALTPLVTETSVLSPEILLDQAVAMELLSTMLPMFVILAVVACVLILPISYWFRMANYVIIDKPGLGAFAALMESRKMMRGSCLKLLKLDISYWWYFAALFGISMVSDGEAWLALLGVELPISGDAAYFLFYALYLALQLAAYYFLRSRVEVTYALAYDSIRPEEKKDNGVILGNIFDM